MRTETEGGIHMTDRAVWGTVGNVPADDRDHDVMQTMSDGTMQNS